MITDQDIYKLKTVFATKEDLADLKLEVGEVKDGVQSILNILHGNAGNIEDLRMENRAGALVLSRHTRQIEKLAKHTGATLPE